MQIAAFSPGPSEVRSYAPFQRGVDTSEQEILRDCAQLVVEAETGARGTGQQRGDIAHGKAEYDNTHERRQHAICALGMIYRQHVAIPNCGDSGNGPVKTNNVLLDIILVPQIRVVLVHPVVEVLAILHRLVAEKNKHAAQEMRRKNHEAERPEHLEGGFGVLV